MDLQAVISILGLLGIGGIVGGYLQHLWNQKTETNSRIQNINENKYRSILVLMRCALNPESVGQFEIEDNKIYSLKGEKQIKKYAMTKLAKFYYNSVLYASDEVLKKLKIFIKNPSKSGFMETAIAMRKDLWNKGTKIELRALSLE